jgi:predicted nuclease of restriction endonuclease-like (RecB) superfamily
MGRSRKQPTKKATPKKTDAVSPATPSGLPAGYAELLEELKSRIRTAQVKASLAVNRELIALHWGIGKAIVERQQKEKWGKSVVDRLAADLRSEFPGVGGLSKQNLWYMRQFYLAWTDEVRNLQQPVGELDGVSLPQAVAGIPWGHNIELLSKVKDPATRLWYAQHATTNGWSRNVLALQIETRLHERQGKAVTNFARTLPAPDSDLAAQLLKDPYTFDFLTLTNDAREREMESGLLAHVRQFLLELGVGFAFVGSQFPLEVAGEDFQIDLLFYHCKLHCYFVIDLKMEEFRPEHAGKMSFYLSAVDDLVRDPVADRPTLGLVLCRRRNRLIAEYALRDVNKPIGVAGFETRLVESLPTDLAPSLPTVEQLERELAAYRPTDAETQAE